MNILFICDELPYPITTGIATRSFNLLTRLAKHHRISIASLTTKPSISSETMAALGRWTERVEIFGVPDASEPAFIRHADLVPRIGRRVQAQLRLRWSAQKMRRSIPSLLTSSDFDLVLICGKWASPSLRSVNDLPIVVDCCDAEHIRIRGEIRCASPLRRTWLMLHYLELKKVEEEFTAITPNIFFASMRDRHALMRDGDGGDIVPNGVDCNQLKRTRPATATNSIVFVGVMDFSPNHDAALLLGERILPQIRKFVPNAKVTLVGRNPKRILLQRARNWDNFQITGSVDNVRDYLEEATVFAAPIRFASGTQNKVLEAMAMELPVVTTSVVADGLRIAPGMNLPIRVADNPDLFATEVVSLLQSANEREILGARARSFVQRYFDWEESAKKLEDICLRAARLTAPQAA